MSGKMVMSKSEEDYYVNCGLYDNKNVALGYLEDDNPLDDIQYLLKDSTEGMYD